ncbi:S1 family peptidase [Bdellovibrio reynosensis]|uniref:Trypsin-like serine protease n=1 Tax=Bdellovibrio reynosensis TaxID=2835041 RepID=A0ABY4C5Z7_9BACT|nr:trypsin-like serine protease [Bdellovibrio reynosensis]UOF00365.1 trypsin-like serine protease [Bdellovibrio reynosensis]
MISKLSTKVLLATVVLSSMVACSPKSTPKSEFGTSTSTASIIGGEKVKADDQIVKSTVALMSFREDAQGEQSQSFCTGTLIAKNVILTAAHCIPYIAEDDKRGGMLVIFHLDLNKATQKDVLEIVDVVMHQDYGTDVEAQEDLNDIALVKFTGELPKGYGVAKLLTDSSLLKKDATVTLAGYGYIKTDGVNVENDYNLRKANVQIYDRMGNTEIVLDQTKGKGACHGDSGGPAFLKVDNVEYVWGVTSRGIYKEGDPDNCQTYSVYTEVAAQAAFIKEGLAKLSK